MADNEMAASFAAQRWRESRREEWSAQTRFIEELKEYADPACTFWTSLDNKPLSPLSGIYQKRRGVKSGLPDVLVIFRQKSGSMLIVFVEFKSHRGVASKAQKQVRLEMLPAGAVWYMVRSAAAAMMALSLAGVVFRRPWEPPRLEPWEGPFANPHQRLPQAPEVKAARSAALKRFRLRQRQKAAQMTEQAAAVEAA
jgi:hypothetical protein